MSAMRCIAMLQFLALFTFISTATTNQGQFLVPPAEHRNTERVVGGYDALIKDHPYQVAMVLKENNEFFCGGFIVSENYVLTAAHCARDKTPSSVILRVGSSWRTNGTIIPVAKLIVHPEYNDVRINKDAAVIRTAKSIKYSDVVQPISIAPKGRAMTPKSMVMVSGWGRRQFGSPIIPEHLRAVEIPVIEHRRCSMAYSTYITDNHWCGGHFLLGGKGACNGDSGGGAVQDGMAVGIVSFGRGCAYPLSPSVFADIAAPSIRDFITQQTGL